MRAIADIMRGLGATVRENANCKRWQHDDDGGVRDDSTERRRDGQVSLNDGASRGEYLTVSNKYRNHELRTLAARVVHGDDAEHSLLDSLLLELTPLATASLTCWAAGKEGHEVTVDRTQTKK